MSLDLKRSDDRPVTRVEELVDSFRGGERAGGPLRIGLEHEKLLYAGGEAVPFEGERGIRALLEGLAAQPGGQPFHDGGGGPLIAVTQGGETISLEPGGQLELSGSPVGTAREAHAENLRHLESVRRVAEPFGIRAVALGYRPFEAVGEMPWMPKRRYGVMRESLGARGTHAHEMMLLTATGQVSLDWRDEADCVRKVVLAARLMPLVVAAYANSPLVRGQPSGWASYRSRVWNDVDSARCGYLPAMFDGSFSYRAYVEWALDAPLLFLRRGDDYFQPQKTFRQLLAEGWEGGPALYGDWVDHLSTLFPEVRLKRVMELRSADCVGPALTGALVAFARGVFYDPQALSDAERLLPAVSYAEQLELHHLAQREGLDGRWRNRPLAAWAQELVAVAREGLGRLDPEDLPTLEPLVERVASGRSPAREVLEAYQAAPNRDAFLEQVSLWPSSG